jgi:Holliday junction resolvase RusA-like endonuclease
MALARATSPATPAKPVEATEMLVSALTIAFPWRFVLHDNHRFVPARGRKGLVASPEYRTAKAEATAWLTGLWLTRPKLTGEMTLYARCWFPDHRKRDAGNYRKLITDALTGVVYADDSQLVSETWERAGFDKVSPRIEVTLRASLPPRHPRAPGEPEGL